MFALHEDDKLWNEVVDVFPVLAEGNTSLTEDICVPPNPTRWCALVAAIRKEDLWFTIEDLLVDKIESHLRNEVAPKFWQGVVSCIGDGFTRFKESVNKLANDHLLLSRLVDRMEALRTSLGVKRDIYDIGDLHSLLNILLRATLQSQLPMPKQLSAVEDFYKLSFQAFSHSERNDREFGGELPCDGCLEQADSCKCDQIIEDFHDVNRKLIRVELLERLAGEVITSLIHKQIESHVQQTCKGSFDVSFITPFEKWLNSVVVRWLTLLYKSALDSPGIQEKLNTFKQKLHHLLYETYTRTRIDQLFTIIIEYPDSDAAIDDLRICLEKTDLRPFLITKLTSAVQTRLLHPGVNTPDIITAYIASIRALRHLDPTGIVLETCTQPVRQYLRGREDTMRCVVVSLTEEGPGDLADELIHGEENNQENQLNWEEWNPDPIDASDATENKERQSWDIISMLVNVYGSEEIFVHEYRKLLADRLLVQNSYNTEKEVRYLDLLKLRFGDSQLHYCEVMLKDIYDSKRLNTHLHSEPNFGLKNQDFEVTAMILSAQFWPTFKEEKLELPQKIKDHLAVYTKAYESIKGNRSLNWKPHLGSVNLDIEVKGRTLNLTVMPTHAAIIWCFQEKEQWTIEELTAELHVPATVLRRRIAYWQSQGLLKEVSGDTFVLVEEPSGRSAKNVAASEMMCEDDEAESIMASAQDQREEELQVFWSYIVGMLTNLESLPPDRIHMMLKMFASQGPSAVECSLQQLKHFLDRKVREHKLLFSGGFYRLPK